MSYAASRHIDRSQIPIIDISALRGHAQGAVEAVAAQMLETARRIGFFYVTGHGVPAATLVEANRRSREFFARPLERKLECKVNPYHRGFLRIGEAKMESATRVDLKESWIWGLELAADDPARDGHDPFLGHNQWPSDFPEFRAALVRLFGEMSSVAVDLMRAFAVSMSLPEDTFIRTARRPVSRGSSIYYPPQPPDMGAEQFGVSPHTDYGCLTLLWQDDVGGLEVRGASGEWLTAHPVEGAFVVNVGDLLARWTNDGFRSTPHRVVNRSGRERYSMALFWDPDGETVIDPSVVCAADETPRYPPVTVAAHITERYQQSFAYRQPAPPSGATDAGA